MTSKQTLLIISAMAAAFVSCSKKEERSATELSPFDITLQYADIPAESETKQSVSNLKYETHWDDSDAVALYNATKGELNRYVVKSGAGTSSAVFTPDGAVPSYASSDELYIIYPFEAASLEDGNLYLSIYRDAEEDSYSLSSNKVFSHNDLLMSKRFKHSSLSEGNLDIGRLTLYRLVALVNLTTAVSHDDLFNEPIGKVRFKCKGVSGKSAVIFTNGVPSLAANEGSEDECAFYVVDAPKMVSKDYLARFVPIFPVNMSQDTNGGFSFILEGDEHTVGFHRALNYTMRSNASVNYFLSNGLFGMTPVVNEAAATTDFSWWWAEKPGLPPAPSDLENHNLYYGEANCVVMPVGTNFATLDVSLYEAGENHARGSRSSSYDSAADHAAVIWYEPGLVLDTPGLSHNGNAWTMTLTAAKNTGGNALVGLYDKDDNLLWSFHVWAPVDATIVTEGLPSRYSGAAYKLALGQVTDDADTYLYYQWGRKDPLGRAPGYDEEKPDNLFSMETGTAPNAKKPSLIMNEGVKTGPVSLDVARLNPTVFYLYSNDGSSAWAWETPTDDFLWEDIYKTIYDPCPKGYRVNPDFNARVNYDASSISDNPVMKSLYGLTFTSGGNRGFSDGSVDHVGSAGYYWTSYMLETRSTCLIFTKGSVGTSSSYRWLGNAVRCVADVSDSNLETVALAHDDSRMQDGSFYYGEANCVVMPVGTNSATLDVSLYEAGYNHVRGRRSFQQQSAAAKARVIWHEPGLVLDTPGLSHNGNVWTMTLTAAKNTGGNALVGLYDKDDNLLWSFHVWAPVVFEDVISNGFTANQFTLGQVTSATDTYMYYQWGRKDPLGRAANFGSNAGYLISMLPGNAPNAQTPSENGTGVMVGPVSLDVARLNPTVFITTNAQDNDWISPQDDNLWRTAVTIYDPCPKGYRIAPKSLWRGVDTSNWNLALRPFNITYNNLTYPAAGLRSIQLNSVNAVGSSGYYWSPSVVDELSSSLYFSHPDIARPEFENGRICGCAVRCVKQNES